VLIEYAQLALVHVQVVSINLRLVLPLLIEYVQPVPQTAKLVLVLAFAANAIPATFAFM
jgi:hypothetical protein